MNPWTLLGIAPTREEREIKRAYTRLLRLRPPETDPAGFQSLREAYEAALFLARFQGSPEAAPPDIPVPDPAALETASGPGPVSSAAPDVALAAPFPAEQAEKAAPIPSDLPPSWEAEARAFLDRIAADFPDHSKRQFEAYWAEVLQSPVLWNLDAKAWIGWNLFGFLGKAALEHRDRPTEVHIGKEAWRLLDSAFGWLEGESALYATFPEDLVDAVLDPIREARGLHRSVDLAAANARASELADLGKEPAWRRFSGLGWLIAIALIQIIRHCSN